MTTRPKKSDTIIQDQQSAISYDEQAQETHWFGSEVVFGLTYEFIRSGDTLLDLGIGSGLSSILFHKSGLSVYGLDGSEEILRVCAAKGFATELKQHDLRDLPLPYASDCFQYVVCVAVLNSFRSLSALFQEVGRLLKGQGIFAFTVEAQKPGMPGSYAINRVDLSERARVETAVKLYRHREEYILEVLKRNGFELLKGQEFVAFKYPAEQRDVFFTAFVARKMEIN